jgi:chorismate mutase
MKKLFALRGAVCVKNESADIADAVEELYLAILKKNNLNEAGIVSLIFSVTNDIDAKNPCQALRERGHAEELPLFAVAEAATKNALPRCIRAIIHCYMEAETKPCHVYMRGAEVLRPDRQALN